MNVCLNLCIFACMQKNYVYMYVCMYVCVNVCVYVFFCHESLKITVHHFVRECYFLSLRTSFFTNGKRRVYALKSVSSIS